MGHPTPCWDEATFWYLLTVERARARRGARSFLMLVADLRGVEPSGDTRRPAWPDLAAALGRCLRETDLVGWHRTGRAAGAILTQGSADPATAEVVGRKVLGRLRSGLPGPLRRAVRVRIYRYGLAGDRMGFDRVFVASGADPSMAPWGVPGSAPTETTEPDGLAPSWLSERVASRRAGT